VRYAPWAAGLIVLVVAIVAMAAVVLPQSPLRTAHPSELWGEWTRPLGRPAPSPGPAPAPSAAYPAVSQTPALYVVEQESPIVAPDETLGEGLGIETPRGKFQVVLARGTPVRYARTVTFGTGADDQKEIRLHLLRGRSGTLAENRSLGWVRIPDLPPGPRRLTRVAVTFQVVDRAIVLVAQNVADGRALTIEASEAPPGFGP
jgi:molecular chaperone DnaK (HSP70)